MHSLNHITGYSSNKFSFDIYMVLNEIKKLNKLFIIICDMISKKISLTFRKRGGREEYIINSNVERLGIKVSCLAIILHSKTMDGLRKEKKGEVLASFFRHCK